MKLRRPVTALLVSSIVISLLCVVYFMALPILNFMFNPATGNNSSEGKILIRGADVLDKSDIHTEFVADDDYKMESNAAAAGEIGEVSYIKGDQVKFESGTKNILLLGANEDLCDSIFIVNINESTKEVKLVSIPRDSYVPYSSDIVASMKKSGYYYSPGSCKLNAVSFVGRTYVHYSDGKFGDSGIDFMCAVLNNLLPYGCEIDQYVYVDMEGFMDIIDVFGGVYVTCEEVIYNSNGNVVIDKGYQLMDSEKALYYVRHRTRLDENGNNTYTGGDVYRKTNQVKFMAEVAGQILTADNLTYTKITAMMTSLKESVFHSFGSADAITEYMNIGLDFASGEYKISMYVVDGDEIDPFGDGSSYVKIY